MKKYRGPGAIAFIAIVALVGCKYSGKYQTITVDNKFSLSIPSWMDKEDNLKPGAAFQYANRYRNFYAIATVTDKTEVKRSNAEIVGDNIAVVKKSLAKPAISDSVDVTIGGAKGVRVEVFGKMSDETIYFSEVQLEGEKRFYHISIWTRGEDRKARYKADIDSIIHSFKEIN